MKKDQAVDSQHREIIDIRLILVALWRAKWITAVLCALAFVYGAYAARGLSQVYVASMLIAPAGEGAGFGSASQDQGLVRAGALGGLIGQQAATSIDRLAVIVASTELAERLQAKLGLLQIVYAGQWDGATQSWIRPLPSRSLRSSVMRRLAEVFPRYREEWSPPTVETLAEFLAAKVRLNKHSKLPYFEFAIEDGDPQFALRLLNAVYSEADIIAREQDRESVERNRAYVDAQLRQRTEVELRTVLSTMLSGIERRRMFLASDLPYVAQVIDPPRVRREITSRNPVFNGATYAFVAIIVLVFGVGVVTVLRFELSRPR
jgi:hypothetical protein